MVSQQPHFRQAVHNFWNKGKAVPPPAAKPPSGKQVAAPPKPASNDSDSTDSDSDSGGSNLRPGVPIEVLVWLSLHAKQLQSVLQVR